MPDEDGWLAEVLDEWIAEVEALTRHLDPEYGRGIALGSLGPHVWDLRRRLAALARSRERGDLRLILRDAIYLAQAADDARTGQLRAVVSALTGKAIDPERGDTPEWAAAESLMAADAQREGLRQTSERRKAELDAKIEGLQTEFDRLRTAGLSLRRAAEILGRRHGVHADTIRRRFRRQH